MQAAAYVRVSPLTQCENDPCASFAAPGQQRRSKGAAFGTAVPAGRSGSSLGLGARDHWSICASTDVLA